MPEGYTCWSRLTSSHYVRVNMNGRGGYVCRASVQIVLDKKKHFLQISRWSMHDEAPMVSPGFR